MNSRQKRRRNHKVRMAETAFRRCSKRIAFNVMRDTPFQAWLKKKGELMAAEHVFVREGTWDGNPFEEEINYGS